VGSPVSGLRGASHRVTDLPDCCYEAKLCDTLDTEGPCLFGGDTVFAPAPRHRLTSLHAGSLLVLMASTMAACTLSSEGEQSTSAASSGSAVGSGGHVGEVGGGDATGGNATSSSSVVGSGGVGGDGAASAGAGGSMGCDAPDVSDPSTGHCYGFFDVKVLYAEVDAACAVWKSGGRFAAVSTEAEYDFLWSQFELQTDFWIGADDLDGDRSWQWVNGETWGEASGWGQSPNDPWKTGEPTGGGGELCLRMKSWLFESKNCDAQAYLCERP
jgi:hypothetical protein